MEKFEICSEGRYAEIANLLFPSCGWGDNDTPADDKVVENKLVVIPNTDRSLVRSSWKSIGFYNTSEEPKSEEIPDTTVFAISGRSWKSRGHLVIGGFVVLKGSTVNAITESFKKEKSYYPVRLSCEEQEIIKDGVFTRNWVFKSAAQAASVIACRAANANAEWKTDDERRLNFGEIHPKCEKSKKIHGEQIVSKHTWNPVISEVDVGDGEHAYAYVNTEGQSVEWRGRMPFRHRLAANA